MLHRGISSNLGWSSRPTQIIGFLAGFGTTFAALPDLLAMMKRRSSAGMNPRMAAILGTFQILWVIYGTLIGSRSIIMWNVIAAATNYLTVGAYLYFRRREIRSLITFVIFRLRLFAPTGVRRGGLWRDGLGVLHLPGASKQ